MKTIIGQQGFTAPGYQLTVARWGFDFSFGLRGFGRFLVVWVSVGQVFNPRKKIWFSTGGKKGKYPIVPPYEFHRSSLQK